MIEESEVDDPEIVDDGIEPSQQPPEVNMSQDCVKPNSQIRDNIVVCLVMLTLIDR